ncbi:hypothetical protein BC567DRAFT_236935 [Phyllosticta citribraziliensis]
MAPPDSMRPRPHTAKRAAAISCVWALPFTAPAPSAKRHLSPVPHAMGRCSRDDGTPSHPRVCAFGSCTVHT